MIVSSAIDQLKSRFRGELLVPGDQQYDVARTVFNVSIDSRPALIARCSGPADVIQAVNLACRENLLVSVRGSGHNVAGFAVCDGGLVIDLSRMKRVTLDAPSSQSPRGSRMHLGRGERRAPALRPCRYRWVRLSHRRFGPDARWWPRLDRAQAWSRT
jgi:FAD binding domain